MLPLFVFLFFPFSVVMGENVTAERLSDRLNEFKIIGGKPARISTHPYQISLQYNGQHSCGGSILSPWTILTAAHCLDDSETSEFTVRAGSSLHDSGGQVVEVSKFIQHPKWDRDANNGYDVAIVKLSTPLILGFDVALVLTTLVEPSTGTKCTASGWGYNPGSGTTDNWNQLQSVDLPIINRSECKKAYDPLNEPDRTVTDRNICGGYPKGDPCQRDWQWMRGGPLVRTTNLIGLPLPVYVQVGFISWQGCDAGKGLPTVYTSIVKVLDFIYANLF